MEEGGERSGFVKEDEAWSSVFGIGSQGRELIYGVSGKNDASNVFSRDVLARWKATEAHILHVARGVLTGHWIVWGVVEVMVPCPFLPFLLAS